MMTVLNGDAISEGQPVTAKAETIEMFQHVQVQTMQVDHGILLVLIAKKPEGSSISGWTDKWLMLLNECYWCLTGNI